MKSALLFFGGLVLGLAIMAAVTNRYYVAPPTPSVGGSMHLVYRFDRWTGKSATEIISPNN